MPQQSRYTNDQFEALMNDVILTLEKNEAISLIHRLHLKTEKPWLINSLTFLKRVFKVNRRPYDFS